MFEKLMLINVITRLNKFGKWKEHCLNTMQYSYSPKIWPIVDEHVTSAATLAFLSLYKPIEIKDSGHHRLDMWIRDVCDKFSFKFKDYDF